MTPMNMEIICKGFEIDHAHVKVILFTNKMHQNASKQLLRIQVNRNKINVFWLRELNTRTRRVSREFEVHSF